MIFLTKYKKQKPRKETPLPLHGNLTVCLIDDDPAVLESTSMLLKSASINVRAYASGREFLADFDEAITGCIILDLHMPGISGFETLDSLRSRGNTVPVVIFSGRSDASTEEFFKKSGAVALLTKPVDHDAMIGLVRDILSAENVGRYKAPMLRPAWK
jgi:FixJ family two-component response regulator